MNEQDMFMRRAIELSVENVRLKRGGPFGALVVKDGQMIAEGTNLVATTNDPTAHAEMMCIRNACAVLRNFQLDGCDLYSSCEPCPMCLGAIYWARPARVYYGGTHKDAAEYGFDDSFIYQQIHLPADQRQIPMKQLLGEEALEGFLEWRRSTEKVLY
jgi:tRNA(Arg) A34 adenosine deaminase TadA